MYKKKTALSKVKPKRLTLERAVFYGGIQCVNKKPEAPLPQTNISKAAEQTHSS